MKGSKYRFLTAKMLVSHLSHVRFLLMQGGHLREVPTSTGKILMSWKGGRLWVALTIELDWQNFDVLDNR